MAVIVVWLGVLILWPHQKPWLALRMQLQAPCAKRPASQSTQLREFFQRLPPNSLCLRSRCEARLGVALWDPILIISRVEPVRRAELGWNSSSLSSDWFIEPGQQSPPIHWLLGLLVKGMSGIWREAKPTSKGSNFISQGNYSSCLEPVAFPSKLRLDAWHIFNESCVAHHAGCALQRDFQTRPCTNVDGTMCAEKKMSKPLRSPECDTLETLVHVVQICPNEGRQVYPQYIPSLSMNISYTCLCVHEYVYTHNMYNYIYI
jgi:hypothetical protein